MSAMSKIHSVHLAPFNAQGLSAYAREVLKLSPAAYWRMNEASGLPQDSSPNARHMSAVSGSPVYGEDGPIDPHDTAADCINYPSAAYHEVAVVSTAVNNMCIAVWVRRSGNTSGDWFQHGTTSGGWQLEFTSTAGAWRGNLPGVGTLGAVATMPSDQWQFIVVGRNAGTWQCYIDSVLTSASFGTAAPGTPVGNTRILGGGATNMKYAHLAYFDTFLTLDQMCKLHMVGKRTLF